MLKWELNILSVAELNFRLAYVMWQAATAVNLPRAVFHGK